MEVISAVRSIEVSRVCARSTVGSTDGIGILTSILAVIFRSVPRAEYRTYFRHTRENLS